MKTERKGNMDTLRVLRENMDELRRRFHVKSIAVFGSQARGQAGAKSDVDILVEFNTPVDLFDFVELKQFLETLLGREVDLVTRAALKPQMRDSVLREAVYA